MSKSIRSPALEEEVCAANWLVRIEAGLNAEEQAAFEGWIAEDPTRAELMAHQAALLSALTWPVGVRGRSRRYLLGAGAAALGLSGLGLVYWARKGVDNASLSRQFVTARGQVLGESLPDASRLWADASTTVQLRYSDRARDLLLAGGRVFVEVAHDPTRPLSIFTDSLTATAVGTAFEVAAFDNYNKVQVSEGQVRVSLSVGGVHVVNAGQALLLNRGGGAVELTTFDAAHVAAWRDHRLYFDGAPLVDVVSEINRYRSKPITVPDPTLAAQAISGVFPVAGLDDATTLQMLADTVDAHVAERPDALELRPKSPPSNN